MCVCRCYKCVFVGKRMCDVCVYMCVLTALFVLLFSLFIDGSTTWLSRTRFVVVVGFGMLFGGCK